MIDLSAGQLVADKYRVDGVIGSGGMGVVLAATHLDLDQLVAIKVLKDVNSEGIARFQREARLIVRLKSVHVARVFDVGTLDDDTPYFVMERLEGEDLARLLERRGPLPVEQAVDYVLEACEAIAEAHTLGMVHRDLKPANLFVARGPGGTGSVKVLDFGISKAVASGREVGELTSAGVALGSPGYMAPEQIEDSRDVDARADIYSLGAILYRVTSGANPHNGETLMSIFASMSSTPLRPLTSIVDVPPAFADVVERCLAQEPADRPESVAALARLLEPFASRRGRASVEQILATMGVGPSSETITLSQPSSQPHADVGPEYAATAPLASTIVRPAAFSSQPVSLPSLVPTPSSSQLPFSSSSSSSVPIVPPAAIAPLVGGARARSSATVLPFALAMVALMAIIGWVAFRKKAPPPPPPTVETVVTPEVESAQPTFLLPTPSETTDSPALVAPPRMKPSRHVPPPPPPRAPAPKKTGDAPPNPNDMPGGRH